VYQPRSVIADVTLLQSLPDEEFVSGMAEVLKYGFALQPELIDEIERSWSAISARDAAAMQSIVTRCTGAKAAVVSADERDDQGHRIFLNYGHTLGHALEALDGYEGLRHGEAISIGMVFAASLAGALDMLDEQSVDRHARLLETVGLPTRWDFDPAQLMHHIEIDKKNEGAQRWVLLEGFGKPVVRDDVDDALLLEILERVRQK
jgi:3-dehydroquinate synthetase